MTRHMFLASTDPKSTLCVCGAEYRTPIHPHSGDRSTGHSDRCTCSRLLTDADIHTDAPTPRRTTGQRKKAPAHA